MSDIPDGDKQENGGEDKDGCHTMFCGINNKNKGSCSHFPLYLIIAVMIDFRRLVVKTME
jgi:hypothetical protein